MKTYVSFFRMRFLTLIQYRTAAWAGIVCQMMFGLMRVMVLMAFYASGSGNQPMALSQAITYVWLGQATLGLLPWRVEPEIADSVLSGKVAYEMVRPIDLYSMWYARTLANLCAPTLLKSVPQFFIALLILPGGYGMKPPAPAAAAAYLASLMLAAALSAAILNLVHALILILQKSDGLVRTVTVLAEVHSGEIIPLKLMPEGIARALQLQPFAGVVDLPAQLFCGSIAPENCWQVLLLQGFWIGVFVLAGRLTVKKGLRRVVLAGG